MAQRTVVTVTCDLDEKQGAETVLFGHDGAAYEVDLCDDHAKALVDALEPFLNVARRAGGSANKRGAQKATQRRSDASYTPADVRAWAQKEGIKVNERGRLNKEVVEKYEYAMGLDKK